MAKTRKLGFPLAESHFDTRHKKTPLTKKLIKKATQDAKTENKAKEDQKKAFKKALKKAIPNIAIRKYKKATKTNPLKK